MGLPVISAQGMLGIVVNVVTVALALWIVGRSTVGPMKAKLSDAFWIAVLRIIIGAVVSYVILFVGFLIALLVWLALIKHFFDTGWLGALGIGLVATIVLVVLTFALRLLGLPLPV